MNLQGSIADLQKAANQLYLKLHQRFKDNALIREIWSDMSQDLIKQRDCLKEMPISFWKQLNKEHNELLQAVVPYARLQVADNVKDTPLKTCIENSLQFEEPTILKVYIPIIRSLRNTHSKSALDFHIMVKAHLSRIIGLTSAFSGDPVIIQRANLMLQTFEREVQEPQVDMSPPLKKARLRKVRAISEAKPEETAKPKSAAKKPAKPKKAAKAKTAAKKPAKPKKAVKAKTAAKKPAKPKKTVKAKTAVKKPAKPKKASSRGSSLAKRAKAHHHRAKRVVKKVVQRRRARR